MRIDVHELILRIPGLTPAEAHALGEAVALRVGHRLAESPPSTLELGSLDLRLTLEAGRSSSSLVEPIADAILARLR